MRTLSSMAAKRGASLSNSRGLALNTTRYSTDPAGIENSCARSRTPGFGAVTLGRVKSMRTIRPSVACPTIA